MLIENKWVVYDSKDDVYYTGDNDNGDPVLESLNSRVRTYKNEKGAKGAIRHIEYSGRECVEFCKLKAVYIERQEVFDVPKDVKENPPDKPESAANRPKFVEVKEPTDWEEVYGFAFPMESLTFLCTLDDYLRASKRLKEMKYCKSTVRIGDFSSIKLCRKKVGDREIFGVIAADGKLYSAGLNGGAAALEKFCDECRKYLMPRVTRGEKSDNRICPACGAENPHFTSHCPKYGEPICEKHCGEGCEYFSGYETTVVYCSYSDKLIERQKQGELDRMIADVLKK